MSPRAYSLSIPECQDENGIIQQASIWVKESFRFESVRLRISFRVVQDPPTERIDTTSREVTMPLSP
jgi:hypothetical protein